MAPEDYLSYMYYTGKTHKIVHDLKTYQKLIGGNCYYANHNIKITNNIEYC